MAAEPDPAARAGAPLPPGGERPPRPGAWERFEEGALLGLSTAALLVATAVMLAEAFSRGVLNHSYFWAEELVRFLVLWAFFLVLGATGRGGYHIRTDLLVARLPAPARRLADALSCCVGIGFSAILVWAAVPQVVRYHAMGMRSDSTLDVPMWVVFLAMPLGGVLLGTYYLRALARLARGGDAFATSPALDRLNAQGRQE